MAMTKERNLRRVGRDGASTELDKLALSKRFIVQFLGGFGSGAAVYAGVKAVTSLLKNPFRKGLPTLGKEIFCTDGMRFATFLGFYPSIYHLAVDILEHVRACKDGWNHSIAGGIAGISIIVEDATRRKMVSLFAIARALGAELTTLVKRGQLPNVPYFETFSFCVCCAFLVYCTIVKKHLLSNGYYRSLLKWSRDYSDDKLTLIFRKPSTSFVTCQEAGIHEHSCTYHAFSDFCRSYPAFAKLYLPIHAAPILLFKRKQLMKTPVPVLISLATDLAASSAFLATMVMLAKYTLCILRNERPAPISGFVPAAAGFVCGLGLLLERAKRRKEMVLFVIPHSLYAIYLMVKNSRFKPYVGIPHGFTMFFSFSMMMIMHAYEREPHSLSQLIRGLLNYFVGKHKSL